MKLKRLSYILTIMLCAVFVINIIPISVSADIGPKPSVHITFKNMGDELCYGTLLSKTKSTGPSSAWDGTEEDAKYKEEENDYITLDYETWKAFVEYEDTDGYYFLQEGWQVNETKELSWTYYPPNSFKILLYYPETQAFIVSQICERYAFDSYYTFEMGGVNIGSVDYNEELSNDVRLSAYKTYNYTQEIISLVARIIITIIIEMAIALLFGFRTKKQLLLLIGVNTVTQIILNVLLNIINYKSGALTFLMFYFLFEIIVFVLEAILYCILMRKLSKQPEKNWFYVVYALVANAVSFGAGVIIAQLLPGIF